MTSSTNLPPAHYTDCQNIWAAPLVGHSKNACRKLSCAAPKQHSAQLQPAEQAEAEPTVTEDLVDSTAESGLTSTRAIYQDAMGAKRIHECACDEIDQTIKSWLRKASQPQP